MRMPLEEGYDRFSSITTILSAKMGLQDLTTLLCWRIKIKKRRKSKCHSDKVAYRVCLDIAKERYDRKAAQA